MDGLDRVDLLPEPSDRRILSAIDPSTSGYHDEWRAEVQDGHLAMLNQLLRLEEPDFLSAILLCLRSFQ